MSITRRYIEAVWNPGTPAALAAASEDFAPKRRIMGAFGLADDADLLAHEAIGIILHRQWLYESATTGYGDRRMAVRHLGDVIRHAVAIRGADLSAAPAAGTPALNTPLPERTVAEAIMQRALNTIARTSSDKDAREYADAALAAVAELRRAQKEGGR